LCLYQSCAVGVLKLFQTRLSKIGSPINAARTERGAALHHSTARAQMSFDQGTVLHLACSDAGIPSCPSQSSLGSEAGTKCIKGRRRRRLLPKQGTLAHFNDYGGGVKRYDIPANKHQPPITSASHSAGRHEIFDPAPPPIAANSIMYLAVGAPTGEQKRYCAPVLFLSAALTPFLCSE
jgi:hypothetical protein